jgi:hypothetical protein
MKKRLLYLFLPLVVVLSAVVSFLPTSTVDAAASATTTEATTYCKSDSKVTDQNACIQGYEQGLQDYVQNNSNQASSYCAQQLVDEYTGQSFDANSCVAGYNEAFNNGSAIQYCVNYSSKVFAGCVETYAAGVAASSPDSSTYCKSPPGGLSSSECGSIYQAGNQASTNASTGSTSTSSTPTCEADGDPLDWILCPIFNGIANLSHWLFNNIVQPWLVTTPISTSPSDPMFKAWSNFRIYGDIFLVIALLVVVFGQSIAGGLVDAYTAKKVLPRLLAAAILINISIYLVAAAVDISNVVGGSLGAVITAPLNGAGAFVIHPNGIAAGKVIGISMAGGTFALTAGIVALLTSTASGIVGWLGLFVVMPMILGILATFLTLVIRKGVILGLVLLSPLAFALYCLPNTEHIFRRWWKLLLEMLMIYPIVVMIFAVADVLSVTTATGNGSSSGLASIVSFVLQFLPLIFVPYAFRLAGGTLARAHEFMTTSHQRMQEGIKGNANDPWSLRNRTKRKVSNSMLMQREANRAAGDTRQQAGRRYGMIPKLSNSFFGQDDVLRARYNKESAEMRESLTGAGDDWRYRGIFARQMAYDRKVDTGQKDANGEAIYRTERDVGWFGTGARTQKEIGPDGREREVKDANGLPVRIGGTGTQFSDEQVRMAKAQGSMDPSHYQTALTYEVTKAGGSDEGQEDLEVLMATNKRNMRDMKVGQQAMPIWIGQAFANQNISKSLKSTKASSDPLKNMETDQIIAKEDDQGHPFYERDSFTHQRETARKVSSYGLSNEDETEIDNLTDNVQNARDFLVLKHGVKVTPTGDGQATSVQATAADIEAARQSQARLTDKARKTGVKIKTIRDDNQARQVLDYGRATADSLNSRFAASGSYMARAGEGDSEVPLAAGQTGAPGKVNDAIQRFIQVAKSADSGPSSRSGPRPAGPNNVSPGGVVLPPGTTST